MSELTYEPVDIYEGLRKSNELFVKTALSGRDAASEEEIKDVVSLWDSYWLLYAPDDYTHAGIQLLKILDSAKGIEDIRSSILNIQNERKQKQIKPSMISIQHEKNQELDFLFWLESKGCTVERQVYLGSLKIDLWIPGELILELKTRTVSCNDVCQAIRYFELSRRPICIIGESINKKALDAISSFNKLIEGKAIVFVTWSTAKEYVTGALKLR
jgi:hypothetical protein